VARYLTQEWLDDVRTLAAAQPERPGATARIQWVVGGAPEGDVKYWWRLEDGHLVENGLGVLADADITLTYTYADARRVAEGELDPNAAFMQGRMKVAGDFGKLMHLLPITASAEYQALQAELRDRTEF
jgi:predicted lipid carrier protein YhbT